MLEALLWGFHNARSGLCFPSYETIAEAAGCALSTVAAAIKVLEDAGVLSWVQRVKRVRERCSDLGRQRMALARLVDLERLRLPGPRRGQFFDGSATLEAVLTGPQTKPPRHLRNSAGTIRALWLSRR